MNAAIQISQIALLFFALLSNIEVGFADAQMNRPDALKILKLNDSSTFYDIMLAPGETILNESMAIDLAVAGGGAANRTMAPVINAYRTLLGTDSHTQLLAIPNRPTTNEEWKLYFLDFVSGHNDFFHKERVEHALLSALNADDFLTIASAAEEVSSHNVWHAYHDRSLKIYPQLRTEFLGRHPTWRQIYDYNHFLATRIHDSMAPRTRARFGTCADYLIKKVLLK